MGESLEVKMPFLFVHCTENPQIWDCQAPEVAEPFLRVPSPSGAQGAARRVFLMLFTYSCVGGSLEDLGPHLILCSFLPLLRVHGRCCCMLCTVALLCPYAQPRGTNWRL